MKSIRTGSTSVGLARLKVLKKKKNGAYWHLCSEKALEDPCLSGTCSKISKSPSQSASVLGLLQSALACWPFESRDLVC